MLRMRLPRRAVYQRQDTAGVHSKFRNPVRLSSSHSIRDIFADGSRHIEELQHRVQELEDELGNYKRLHQQQHGHQTVGHTQQPYIEPAIGVVVPPQYYSPGTVAGYEYDTPAVVAAPAEGWDAWNAHPQGAAWPQGV